MYNIGAMAENTDATTITSSDGTPSSVSVSSTRSVTLFLHCSECKRPMIRRAATDRNLCKLCSIKERSKAAAAQISPAVPKPPIGRKPRKRLFDRVLGSKVRVEKLPRAFQHKNLRYEDTDHHAGVADVDKEDQTSFPSARQRKGTSPEVLTRQRPTPVSVRKPTYLIPVGLKELMKLDFLKNSPLTALISQPPPQHIEDELGQDLNENESSLSGRLLSNRFKNPPDNKLVEDEAWLAQKQREIEARGGKARQYQVLLPKYLALERWRKGWNSHQTRDPRKCNQDSLPGVQKAANELLALPNLQPELIRGEYVLTDATAPTVTRARRKAAKKYGTVI